ncbi:cellulase family glycosylhydrolase [Candidatus Saccharibacteria bacterium]|jgi:hypothetical protein|nr:cellulase family glycosylhydrolase [Candidatus Saccharibacteria bacterium]MBP7834665.1 cellulase family glycosylhydrolase [Candidatus Saccharibacteria bacterium]
MHIKSKIKKPVISIILSIFVFAVLSAFGFGLYTNRSINNTNITTSAAANTLADLNMDGIVNIQDLSILISKWSTNSQPSDINKDGIVNIQDLSILISGWGTVLNQTTEAFYSKYPDPFVDSTTNLPVVMNGLNYRDVGRYSVPDQTAFNAVKSKGFNIMRFVIYWKDFETTKGQYNQVQMDRLDQAIAQAKTAGINVILDPIHAVNPSVQPYFPTWAVSEAQANGWDSTESVVNSGLPFLKMVANRYKNEKTVIAIDLVNEPNQFPNNGPWDSGSQVIDWNRLFATYNLLINEVRTIDSDKILLIEPNNGDVNPTNADFSLLTNKTNIVWSPHFYYAGGADSDGYSASGWSTGTNVADGTTGYPTVDRNSLDRHIAVHVDKMKSPTAQLPIHIGEYGIGDGSVEGQLPPPTNVPANHDQWLIDVKSVFDKYNLSRTAWEWTSRGTMSATYSKTGPNNINGYPSSYTFKPWVDLIN